MVSVVIPTYNREKFISRALDSVLKQTYKDIEIIVVDDNSKDKTYGVVKEYMENYKFIKYIKHEKNKGGSAARNTGVRESNGEIIAFLDSDDEWIDTKIEKCMSIFNRDKDISLIYSDIYLIDEDTKSIEVCNKYDYEDPYYAMMKKNIIGGTSSIVIRRKAFDKAGGFKEGLPSCQDWDFYLEVVKNNKIYRIPEPLTKYYVHSNSISGNITKVIEGHKHMLNKVISLIDTDKCYLQNKNEILSEQYITIAQLYANFGNYREARANYFKALKLNLKNKKALKNSAVCLLGEKVFFEVKRNFSKSRSKIVHGNR